MEEKQRPFGKNKNCNAAELRPVREVMQIADASGFSPVAKGMLFRNGKNDDDHR